MAVTETLNHGRPAHHWPSVPACSPGFLALSGIGAMRWSDAIMSFGASPLLNKRQL